MVIKTSERIRAVGSSVDAGLCRCVADIGCDHGYTSILIAQNNPGIRVIACDIGDKPLSMAKANIKRFGFNDSIETRLGGGFSQILPGEADCAVLSGMGGLLIIEILSEGKSVTSNIKQLVLQPQRDLYEVRKFLHSSNFSIVNEDMVFEDGKYYTVMSAVRGTERYDNEYDYIYGKKLIEKKSEVFKNYIEHMLQKQKNILSSMRQGTSEDSKKKLTEVIYGYENTLEVYECLQR